MSVRREFPKHKIPLGLMLKDLFTPRCGIRGKLRALYSGDHPSEAPALSLFLLSTRQVICCDCF